ncbi:MAG: RidA family protein [Bacteroidota bacterium]
MGLVEQRLKDLGFALPPLRPYVADYVPAKMVGDLVFCSGHGPTANGQPVFRGRVGREITLKQAVKAAELATLNCLATIKSLIEDLDRVAEVVKVTGFVNSAEDFFVHSDVLNGCSRLLVQVFGEERGKHARTTIGTSNLVNNLPVIIDMIVQVRQG